MAFLPKASRKRREETAATTAACVAAAHAEINRESLSDLAKMLWDGQATMTTSGLLQVGKISFRHSDTKDNDLKKKAIVSRIGSDPRERGRIPCRLRVLKAGAYRLELACSAGDWVPFPFTAVFKVAELTTAVRELVAALQTSGRGAGVPSVDWSRAGVPPVLTYTHLQLKGPPDEPATKRLKPPPPGRRPGDEIPPKPVKRRKLPAPRFLPIRNAATAKHPGSAGQAASGTSLSSRPL
ncbi:hypothetical protein BCV69DRAFT_299982 [Microstroma glucosiphilum]|uniref:Uncharacterized protein n=1 Tax=Pseudomicrostroma glucosiphilum TaxID=1684307 RepID=A0A316U2Y2_9BASI|nr:hypothetical protein BCV69DRAFT_299982 [Pseudomicrostroma glucosiphilum]PWN19672.1 hypothetical protein BCV69DRAFT_299982 [Pseudomicrostroma glucosiphilum]